MTKASEFQRGWPIVATAMVGAALGVSSITLYTAGLFLAPLEAATEWTRTAITSAAVAATFGIAIASPFFGFAIDRFGPRPLAVASLIAVALCFLGLSAMPLSIAVFLGLNFLLGALGSGSSPISFTRVVNAWFREARGLALGITLMGSGVVAVIAPLFLGPIIQNFGWRIGYLSVAIVVALAAPLVWQFLHDPAVSEDSEAAAAIDAGSSFGEALRSRSFWLMAAAFLLAAAAITGSVIHFVPILIASGVTPAAAAKTASVFGIAIIFSRVAIGFALDRIFAPWVAAAALVGAAAGCLLLRAFGAEWSLLAGFLIGFVLGTELDVMSYMISRYYGLKAYARIYGVFLAVYLISAGLGPPIFGAVFDRTGGYAAALGMAVVLLILSAMLTALLPPYPSGRRSSVVGLPSEAALGA
jgi:MFS family permease